MEQNTGAFCQTDVQEFHLWVLHSLIYEYLGQLVLYGTQSPETGEFNKNLGIFS
jgi:hypothetical protein